MPGVLVKMDPAQPSASKIHEDALFFDKLVELVPAKFYFGTEEEDQSWKYMHNKNKTPAAKQAAKEGLKKAKRAKLDPSSYTSNLEIQKKRAQQEAAAKDQEQGAGPQQSDRGPLSGVALQNGGAQPSHAELKERLQQKIEGLRAKREVEEEKKERKKRKRDEDKKGQKEGARKDGGKVTEGTKSLGGEDNIGGGLQSEKKGVPKKAGKKSEQVDGKPAVSAVEGPSAGDAKEEGARLSKKAKPAQESQPASLPLPAPPPLQFNKLEIEAGNKSKRKEKHKNKKDQKKVLLKKATELQTELKETAGTKEGQEKIAKVAWSASLKRASGEKVLDDPKLLKKSIKSEEKRREHSAKKWKGRKAQDREAVKARQEKRSTNLKQRSDAKKERKIQKREKKLLSPGRKKST